LYLERRLSTVSVMFHPVPRVDRWEPLLAALVAAIIAVVLLVLSLWPQ
jgi:hypothetical protein